MKLSEVSVGDNEGITTTGESTRQQDTEHISTKQCSAYGIVPGTDADNIEYETLESEHTTQQCSAYGIVPGTDADDREYETLESEHISTQQCSAVHMV